MNKEEIKKTVVDYIDKNELASYAELQRLFEKEGYDYKRKLLPCSDVYEHVVFWSGRDAEASDLMTELLYEGMAYREPVHPLRYLMDGVALTLPKVQYAVQYKTDHWAPVVFVRGLDSEFMTSQVRIKAEGTERNATSVVSTVVT